MKSFTERDPVKLAVGGITLLVVSLAVAFNANRLPLIGDGPLYHAEFADASGLAAGQEVRIAGIKVGSVSAVQLDGDHVVADFHVKNATFGTATKASIEIKTLLGEHYLALEPAGPGAVDEGGTIPLARTSVPLNIVPATQQLTEQNNAIDTQRVAQAFDALSSALNASTPEARATLDGLSKLSHTISSRDTQLQQLFARAHSVAGTIASQDGNIDQLIAGSNQVLEVLDHRRDSIHEVLTGTRDLAEQLSGLVHDNQATLGPALDQLHQVETVLQKDDDQINQILQRLPAYYRVFTNVVGNGRYFDSTVKAPRSVAACDVGAPGSLSALLDPILEQADRSAGGSGGPCLPLGPAADAVNPQQGGGQ
ncbi:MCE family protein [Amycolatopsis sp. K13G38]|uniref:MCE family protein n=1 Tax=Amycolatopsis acididurans TaxID=2724524 RepID=A0ABX1JDD6_9PSEU|nr:MlaD family protein [Amycolatopsis acididurans]NKQ57753.1 MCE family protein [Amycolatopsis acididurans]